MPSFWKWPLPLLLVVGPFIACSENSKNPPEGMVYIPGGVCVMGSEPPNLQAHELPTLQVSVDGFFIDTHEVTVEQYGQFLAANPNYPLWVFGKSSDNFPNVRWFTSVGMRPMPMRNGRARNCPPKRNGNLPRAAALPALMESRDTNFPGATRSRRIKPITTPTAAGHGIGKTPSAICAMLAVIRLMATGFTMWPAMCGNGAPTFLIIRLSRRPRRGAQNRGGRCGAVLGPMMPMICDALHAIWLIQAPETITLVFVVCVSCADFCLQQFYFSTGWLTHRLRGRVFMDR